jgi:hypothetical protein
MVHLQIPQPAAGRYDTLLKTQAPGRFDIALFPPRPLADFNVGMVFGILTADFC